MSPSEWIKKCRALNSFMSIFYQINHALNYESTESLHCINPSFFGLKYILQVFFFHLDLNFFCWQKKTRKFSFNRMPFFMSFIQCEIVYCIICVYVYLIHYYCQIRFELRKSLDLIWFNLIYVYSWHFTYFPHGINHKMEVCIGS